MTVEQAPPPPGLIYILGWWREVSTAPLMSAVALTARPRAQTGVAHIADDAGNVMYGIGVSAATDPEGRALLTLVWVEGAVYDVEFGGVKGTLRCDDWAEGSTVPFTGIRGIPGGDGIADPLTWDAVISGLNGRIAAQVPPAVSAALAADPSLVAGPVEDYLTAHPLTDADVSALIGNPATETRAAIDTAIDSATVQKFDEGGVILRPIRTPTLAVGRTFPNPNAPYRILWASADGLTLYATERDNTLRKSTDGGLSWVKRGYHANGFGGSMTFVKTAAGTLLTFKVAFPLSNVLMRSADDGATWTEVYSDPSRMAIDIRPMHATSMRQDPVTGYIYWGEYQGANIAATIRIFRSTDDGATWSVWKEFDGPTSSNPNKIRHVHAVEWDPIMGRITFMIGDDDPKAGIYRVNAAGTDVEPMVTNDMLPAYPAQRWARSICYIPFPDYIVWGGDTMSSPYIMRMARSEVGKANPAVERLYKANSTMWFAQRASEDGTRWIMTASQESPGGRLDSSAHVYSVQDQGDVITEVGTISVDASALLAPYPIGGSNPTGGGDTFYMGFQEGANSYSMWRCELARGGGQMVPKAGPIPYVLGLQTVSSGYVTIPGASEITIGVAACSSPRFRLHEVALRALPTANAGLKMEIRTSGGSLVWATGAAGTPVSQRKFMEEGSSPYFLDANLALGTELHFVIKNTNAGAINAVAHATFGFGGDLAP